MGKKIRFFAASAAFLLLFGALFTPLKELVCRKSLTGAWDMTNKVGGFFNEPEDSIDLLFLGASHTYASFDPVRLETRTGRSGYVLATQRQPLWATYAYLTEALKTQSPALAVLDCRGVLEAAADYNEDGVTYSYMDDLPLSWGKVRLAWVSSETMEGRVELLCNFIKYHERWTALTDADYTFDRSALHDPLRGYVRLEKKDNTEFPRPAVVDTITDAAPLDEKNEYWLRRIIVLCQKRGIPLWLVKTPSNLDIREKQLVNRVAQIAAEYGVPFDDFNESYEIIGLTPLLFYDEHHLDAEGAAKFTDFFAERLIRRYPALFGQGG